MFKKLAAFAVVLALSATAAQAVNLPPLTFWDPTNALGTINSWITGVLNPGVTIGSTSPNSLGRNLLDNGDQTVDQRATTVTTMSTTSGCSAASYGPDRWCGNVNMASGAGAIDVGAAFSSTPVLPGLPNYTTLNRTGGALLQPQCAIQELPTAKSAAIAGQTVNLSVYAEALAGLAADNGNTANLYVFTGTAASQGLGALRSAVGMTATVKQSSFTISTTTGLITNASTVVAGQPVTITAATIPTGIVAGQTYYVSSALLNSGTAFAIAPTYAQAIAGTNTVIPSSAGTTNVINLPAITPVWTGLAIYGANGAGQGQTSVAQAFGQAASFPFTLSPSSWTRIQTGPINIPTGTEEAAVAICFHPAGTTSGSGTDGIAFTGAQLEIMGPNQVVAGPYEFKTPSLSLSESQRYYIQLNDLASGTPVGPIGTLLTTATCGFVENFPTTMDIAPVFNAIGTITTTTFQIFVAADTSTLTAAGITAATLTSPNGAGFTATLTTASTAGWACELMGQTAQVKGLSWTADF